MLLWSKEVCVCVCVCVFVCMCLGGGVRRSRGPLNRAPHGWAQTEDTVWMSLMSLQLFVLCAEFAHMHTHTHTHTHADKDTHQARAENWRVKQGWRTGGRIFRREGVKEPIFDVVFVRWTALSALKRSNASCNSTQQIQREIKEARGQRRVGGGQREEEEGRGGKCVFCCQKGYCSVQIWALSQSCNQCASAWGASVRVCVFVCVCVCVCVCTSERRVCGWIIWAQLHVFAIFPHREEDAERQRPSGVVSRLYIDFIHFSVLMFNVCPKRTWTISSLLFLKLWTRNMTQLASKQVISSPSHSC